MARLREGKQFRVGTRNPRRYHVAATEIAAEDLDPELRGMTAPALAEALIPELALVDPDASSSSARPDAATDLTAAADPTHGCISSFQNVFTGRIKLRNCGQYWVKVRAVVHRGPDIACHWLYPGQSSTTGRSDSWRTPTSADAPVSMAPFVVSKYSTCLSDANGRAHTAASATCHSR